MLTGRTFQSINPATGQVLGSYHEAQPDDVDTAARAALQAFRDSQSLPQGWQAELLEAIADAVMAQGDTLLEVVEAETALARARTTAERARAVNQIRMFAAVVREGSWVEAVIDRGDAARTPHPRPDLRRMLVSRGPVAVFGASNFPLAFGTLGGDTASALAAGNPVIVKGHPSHPGTSVRLEKAVHAALAATKLPTGLFTLLQGKTHELSQAVVRHPDVRAVGFTGSQRGGRALYDLAAARPAPIPVFAEMGSLNPLVVLPGAMAERAEAIAKGLAASVLMGAGQFCTKPGVVVTIGEASNLVARLADEIRASTSPLTMLNAGLRDAFCERAGKFGRVSGVSAVVSGCPSEHAGVTASLFETTAAVFLNTPELREEAFGPAAVVVRCEDVDDALAVIRVIGGSLTATVHAGAGDDPAVVRQFLRACSDVAGRVIVNGYPTGVEVNHAIAHTGPYPATTDPASTSVGAGAIRRFARLLAHQDVPDELLPAALQDANPLGIWRTVDGERTKDAVRR